MTMPSKKHLEDEQRHATKVVGDKVVWTNAKDENGELVPPTTDDLARLGAEGYVAYQQRVRDAREARKNAKREEQDRQLFEQQFVAAGGSKADAEKEWKQYRNETAAQAARRADQLAAEQTRTRTRARL